jgi:hypothetical protein
MITLNPSVCHRQVIENRMLMNIWTKDEVIRGWRKLHNEELHNLYSSPRIIKSKRKRWTVKVASRGGRGTDI